MGFFGCIVLFLSEITLCVTFLGNGDILYMYTRQGHNYFYGLLAKSFQSECVSVRAFTEGILKQCFTVIGHGHALATH